MGKKFRNFLMQKRKSFRLFRNRTFLLKFSFKFFFLMIFFQFVNLYNTEKLVHILWFLKKSSKDLKMIFCRFSFHWKKSNFISPLVHNVTFVQTDVNFRKKATVQRPWQRPGQWHGRAYKRCDVAFDKWFVFRRPHCIILPNRSFIVPFHCLFGVQLH